MQSILAQKSYYQNLTVPTHFGGDINEEYFEEAEDWCDEHKGIFDTFYHGVSKVAFISDNLNWVIKIPFNSYCYDSWDEEKNDYDMNIATWYPYCEAGAYGWDYCALELEFYEEVKEQGLEMFLAETSFFCCTANDYPIYIQEKVVAENEYDSTTKKTPSQKSLSIAKTIKEKNYTRLSNKWIATAIDFYGEDKVKEFLKYMNDENPRMEEDLHGGNYGYRCSDGSPCLLDFSGWGENI